MPRAVVEVVIEGKALGRKAAAAVIGDSTFFHSGVTPLIDALYNESEGLVLVLDNRTTAMTGHQGHPGTGLRPDRSQGPVVDVQRLCEGIGVRCTTVDANDHKALDAAIKAEAETPGLGVVVALAPCVLMMRERTGTVTVDDERCNLCGLCLDIGCPALAPGEVAMTLTDACTGCGLCVEVCRRGALVHEPAARRRLVNGTTTVSLVGVGGQGILLGAAVLAETAMAEGLDVKASEVKGMAQRGGSVLSTVRFGRHVYSPVARHADLVFATELLEGLRGLDLLASRGTLVCATTRILPGSVLRGEEAYPDELAAAAAARGVRLMLLDAEELAREAGNVRAVNVVLLGAASLVLPFSLDAWERGLAAAVPAKILDVNRRAFALGRDAGARQEVSR